MLNPEIIRQDIPQRHPNKSYDKISGLFKKDQGFVDADTGFRSGARKKSGFKLALWSWMSASIDTLVLISLSCFSVVIFSLIMKTQAREFFRILAIDNTAELFVLAFLFSAWGYLVMMRLFLGASLGEWTCSLRLGQPAQRVQRNYALKVILRTTVVLLTGVIVLPLLSLVFKRDLAGKISGLHVYSLNP
ncbi:hypothetical protein [Pseudobdellovibrio exovorus]|uniref:RDD domain-containing protein n=1 Tax=Pseudobdellovibrio exovorus JSS TaxID=1184267 RepID=M4VBY1_9BACT|nr:hypothetical protein [Pseudobdellovibrio exovorus]AGH95521.1 hypothetical protein A11Q_1305 [Pseudobdellovibrio exovorus JSS]